jgi:hypothetical protein
MAEIAGLRAAGEPVGAWIADYQVARAAHTVADWQATLDALAGLGYPGPLGYWGVSLGTLIGVPLAAAEPRIGAAVFGLAPHDPLAGSGAALGRTGVRAGQLRAFLRPPPERLSACAFAVSTRAPIWPGAG